MIGLVSKVTFYLVLDVFSLWKKGCQLVFLIIAFVEEIDIDSILVKHIFNRTTLPSKTCHFSISINPYITFFQLNCCFTSNIKKLKRSVVFTR